MSVDEKDEIQALEYSRVLTKKQGEGFVSFSAGSGDYNFWKIFGAIFMTGLISLFLFTGVTIVYKAITTERLVVGGLVSLFVIVLLKLLCEHVLELYEEVVEIVYSNTYLILTREYIEVYWSPLKILKQKIFIKNIESIDIQWQRFFWGGTKVPIEDIKEKFIKDKHAAKGYYSFKVNLQNGKSKMLNFKLREIAVLEKLSAYIINPQQFSVANLRANQDGVFIESKEEILEIYSSEPLFSKSESKNAKSLVYGLTMLMMALVFASIVDKSRQMTALLMGFIYFLMSAKTLYLILYNARIKKIEVTPSLLTESRIGLFSKPKNRAEFTKEEIDSFFVKGQENTKKYTISIILKKGVSHDLFIVFKERKTAEELIEKIKLVLANESRILIDSDSDLSQMDLNTLEEGSDEALDSEKEDVG